MEFSKSVAIFFAASIAVAVAYPPRGYYESESDESIEYPESSRSLGGSHRYALTSAPFFYHPRNIPEIPSTGRKYTVVKKKKGPNGQPLPGSDEDDDDEPQDEEESSEEDDEDGDEEEDDLDTPAWEQMFPDEDKNTGNFDDPQGGGGPGGASLQDIPGGAPAPATSNTGSLWNLLTGGGGGGSDSSHSAEAGPGGPGGHGGHGGYGGNGGHGGGPGGPGGPPPPQYRNQEPPFRGLEIRGRSGLNSPRSGGSVLYDGYRYIPVRPVPAPYQQREGKKIKKNSPNKFQPRSLNVNVNDHHSTSLNNQQYVLVPVGRDGREVRFATRESEPAFAPTEIWRWEGPGGRPLKRRENRPSAPHFGRPQRGTSSIRFREEHDY